MRKDASWNRLRLRIRGSSNDAAFLREAVRRQRGAFHQARERFRRALGNFFRLNARCRRGIANPTCTRTLAKTPMFHVTLPPRNEPRFERADAGRDFVAHALFRQHAEVRGERSASTRGSGLQDPLRRHRQRQARLRSRRRSFGGRKDRQRGGATDRAPDVPKARTEIFSKAAGRSGRPRLSLRSLHREVRHRPARSVTA